MLSCTHAQMVATERVSRNGRKSFGVRLMDRLSGSSVVIQSTIAREHWETVKRNVKAVNDLTKIQVSFERAIDGMHDLPRHGKRNVRDHYLNQRDLYRGEA